MKLLSVAVRQVAPQSAAARRMGTAAASVISSSSDVQAYISEAPAATVSKLANGVTVASLYSADG